MSGFESEMDWAELMMRMPELASPRSRAGVLGVALVLASAAMTGLVVGQQGDSPGAPTVQSRHRQVGVDWKPGSSLALQSSIKGDGAILCLDHRDSSEPRVLAVSADDGRELWRVNPCSHAKGAVLSYPCRPLELIPFAERPDGSIRAMLIWKRYPEPGSSEGVWYGGELDPSTGETLGGAMLPVQESSSNWVTVSARAGGEGSQLPEFLQLVAGRTHGVEGGSSEGSRPSEQIQVWGFSATESGLAATLSLPPGQALEGVPSWVAPVTVARGHVIACTLRETGKDESCLWILSMDDSLERPRWLRTGLRGLLPYSFIQAIQVSDFDADLAPDYVVAITKERRGKSYYDRVVAGISGQTGLVLYSLTDHDGAHMGYDCSPKEWGCEWAYAMAPMGDLNGDGLDEIAVGSTQANAGDGAVVIMESSTGEVLKTLTAPGPSNRFGAVLASGVDIDADGVQDLAVAGCTVTSGCPKNRVWVYSGRSLELRMVLESR